MQIRAGRQEEKKAGEEEKKNDEEKALEFHSACRLLPFDVQTNAFFLQIGSPSGTPNPREDGRATRTPIALFSRAIHSKFIASAQRISFAALTGIRPVPPTKTLRLNASLLGAAPLAFWCPSQETEAEGENDV